MKLEQVLKVAVKGGASDILLKTGSVPRFRHNGKLISLSEGTALSPEIMKQWIDIVLPRRLSSKLSDSGDIDFGYNSSIGTRFRVNLFKQRGQLGMVLRVISNNILSLEKLFLPDAISNVAKMKRGIVLITGATGSGKSSTLAAIVENVNNSLPAHILTIEDPIEFYYEDNLSTINQREIGEDCVDFSSALRSSLRQSPDIILVGELRDHETIETALMAAETGHLVLSTLHTKNAVDSLTRLLSFFSPEKQQAVRMQLANSLQMVVSQRLLPRADGGGRVAAVEILVNNSLVQDVILEGNNFNSLNDAIQKGNKTYGMQSFDQSLLMLYKKKIISKEQAIHEASSRENMKLLMSGINS